jgi:putative endonuclease
MKLSYVYILKCSDKSYYTGVTSNLDGRMFKHDSGFYPNCYTFNRRPLTLAFYCEFTDINMAFETEKQIKNWSRSKKEALINGEFDKLQWLSECRNASHYKYDPNKKEELD